MGVAKRDDRPLGVAVRRYYRSPARADDDYLESHLELWDRSGPDGLRHPKLLPGYGWIFGLGDGTVNVGLGMLSSSKAFGEHRLSSPAADLAGRHPGGVGAPRGERARPDRRRRPADGLQPDTALRATACCWSATPAAWSTRSTARGSHTPWSPQRSRRSRYCRPSAGPRGRAGRPRCTATLRACGSISAPTTGWAGSSRRLIGKPVIMKTATRLGLPRKDLMYLVLKLLAGLYDRRDGDWADRIVRSLTRMAPSV